MSHERMQQELPLAGYDQLRPLGTPAARLPTQIVPPIPRAPEFLRQPSEQSFGLHSQVNALAGPSSRPQDVPLNTVSKESLEPILPTSSPILPGPTPPDEPRSNPPPPRITCKGWSVPELCGKYTNFREVRRVKASALSEDPSQVLDDYERKGEPLIVEGLHQHSSWREDILNMEWLLKNAGDKEIHVRNVHNRKDYPTTFAEFVRISRDQDVYNSPGETQRLYWKDADCPTEWKEWLAELLPAELLPGCSSDLLRHLYPSEAVESLMCYLGIGDTFTAAHKDLCSSSGHNLMCFSENGGSSFWFMTESDAAPQAAEWFQKELGQELDWETHVTTVDELGKAPFNVYIAEQKVGDLVLVPPRSVHQVVNQGGLAMKTSWSRMTLHGLRSALHHELPVYRRVCRPEQYRVKTILYRTMLHHTQRLQSAVMSMPKDKQENGQHIKDGLMLEYGSSSESGSDRETSTTPSPQPTNEDLAKPLRDLIQLFDEVLREEYASCHKKLKRVIGSSDCSGWSVATEASTSRKIVLVPPRDARDRTEKHRVSACNFACDFCGADIFQSFFECRACSAAPEECTRPGDGLLICPACYVEGRSCACDGMEPVQCRPLQVLIDDRNRAAAVLREVGNNLSGDSLEDLRPSDLKRRDDVCVFEAACQYQTRKQNYAEKTERSCRPGGHGSEHPVPVSTTLPCTTCRIARCFPHLLRQGTHVAEAIIAHGRGDTIYHSTHKNNAAAFKRSPPKLYGVRGSKAKHRLLDAAMNFPRCKPLHTLTKVGFYDTETEMDFEAEDDAKPEVEPEFIEDSYATTPSLMIGPQLSRLNINSPVIHAAFDGEMSPLPEEFMGSPARLNVSANSPEVYEAPSGDPYRADHALNVQEKQSPFSNGLQELGTSLNNPEVRLDVCGDPEETVQGQSPSVSPTVTAVDTSSEVEVSIIDPSGPPRLPKARLLMAYVEISQKRSSQRNTTSISEDTEEVEPLQKKPRSARQDAIVGGRVAGQGRSESRVTPPAMRPSASHRTRSRSRSEDDYVEGGYGEDLASALTMAQGNKAPIFSQSDGRHPSGALLRRPTTLKRIMSPESDSGAAALCSEPSTARPPLPNLSPASSSPTNPPPNPVPRLPRTKRSAAPSEDPRDRSNSRSTVPATSSSSSAKGPRTQKRKRVKVPGAPTDEIDDHLATMRSQQQEEGHRHKKARLEQHTGNEDLEIIEIDDEPVPVNVPRPQVLSQSQPDISDHGRPPSPPRRSPLQHPPPGLRDPALAPATADPSVAGPRSSYNVQAALQPCDSGLAPISNTPPLLAVLAGPPQLASAGAPPRPFVLADPMQSQIVTDDSSSVPDASATADASAVPFDQIVADLGTRADALATSVKHAAVYLARNTWTEGERRQQVMQVVAELDHRLTFVETTQRSVDERWGRDEEIAELREQLRQAKEDMAEVRQELKKERAERAHIAAEARALKARLDRCVEAEDVGNVVEAQISRMMPTMRNSVKDMVQQIHDNYVTQQLQQANFFSVQHDQKPMAFPPRDGFAYQPPPQVNESRYQDHRGQSNHPRGRQQHPRVQLESSFPNGGLSSYHNPGQHHHGSGGGPSGYGGQFNSSDYWQQNGDRFRANSVNNWSRRTFSHPQGDDRHFGRDHRQGESLFLHGSRYQPESSRDNEGDLGHHGRRISEHPSTRPLRHRSPSTTRSHHSGDTDLEQPSFIRQSEESLHNGDKARSMASIGSIEEYTSEKSQLSPSDIQGSSFSQKESYSHLPSGDHLSRRRSRSRDRHQSSRRSPSRYHSQRPPSRYRSQHPPSRLSSPHATSVSDASSKPSTRAGSRPIRQ